MWFLLPRKATISTVSPIYADSKASSREGICIMCFEGDIYPLFSLRFYIYFLASIPSGPRGWGFEITLRHITLGRTSLDEWSARRRYFYLTTYETQKRNIYGPGWIRTLNPRNRAAADVSRRPLGHRDCTSLVCHPGVCLCGSIRVNWLKQLYAGPSVRAVCGL